MRWQDIKKAYPDQWLIIEAIKAHTTGKDRVLEEINVVDSFNDDNKEALRRYVELHKNHPNREFYVVHTSRTELNIKERTWSGIRRAL